MFINREQELNNLEHRYRAKRAELFVLYGRRRIGKTELLLQFCKDKRSIYFLASQLKESDHLMQINEVAQIAIDDPLLRNMAFNDWESALVYFAQNATEAPLVVVLDEFQYLCEANTALPSLIQRFWDLHGKNSNLFLILCGSHVSFMEHEVLAERSPLYGRRTGQLKLQPLSYRDSGRFYPEFTSKEKTLIYGILGGVPSYLSRFTLGNSEHIYETYRKSIEQNIINELLIPQGYLFDEVNFLLRTELREPRTYASILQAIASGMTRLNEISQRVGLNTTSVNKYVSVLRELGLVKRVVPLTERARNRSKKGIYKIADNYVKFWHRFVLPYRSLIESGNSDLVYNRMIAPNLSHYMGDIFEDVCRQYVVRYWQERIDIAPKQVGAHWESDLEIDIMTENLDDSNWFGECKWWKSPVGENVLNKLIAKVERLPEHWRKKPNYMLFSASEFTDSLKQRASKEGVFLIDLNDLFYDNN